MAKWSEADLTAYYARRGIGPASQEPESRFLARVLTLARDAGWLAYHTHDSRRSAPGFPDLTLVKPGRLLFAELKTARGKLTRDQMEWLGVLGRSCPGVEVYVWRPRDWAQIVDVLNRKGRS